MLFILDFKFPGAKNVAELSNYSGRQMKVLGFNINLVEENITK